MFFPSLVQSAVFPTAYHSNENMLVCAPTGAGKTNVAMLTVVRELGQHFVHGILMVSRFVLVVLLLRYCTHSSGPNLLASVCTSGAPWVTIFGFDFAEKRVQDCVCGANESTGPGSAKEIPRETSGTWRNGTCLHICELHPPLVSRYDAYSAQVRELTGDMQLTRKEIDETQVIVWGFVVQLVLRVPHRATSL